MIEYPVEHQKLVDLIEAVVQYELNAKLKEFQELKRKLAELEKQVDELIKKPGRPEQHVHHHYHGGWYSWPNYAPLTVWSTTTQSGSSDKQSITYPTNSTGWSLSSSPQTLRWGPSTEGSTNSNGGRTN